MARHLALSRLSRLVAVPLLAAMLAALGGVSVARGATAEVEFVSPAATGYHVVGPVFTVSWQETITPDARELVQEEASLDREGGCSSVAWQAIGSIAAAETSVQLQLLADRCYRWTITLTAGEQAHSATSAAVRTLKAWAGKLNLYLKGVFSAQLRWDWCVAASVQMMLNIIRGEKDHSRAGQKAYYLYSRANDLTPDRIPGADPRGWARTLSNYGGGSYSDVSSPTFKSAMRRAAKRMRLTGRPVGVIVRAGDHAMVLNGFSATADPATTDSFDVTAVFVMGPLWPDRPSYDPAPNTKLTAAAFKRKYFSRYDDPFGSAKWSVWEGSFVTINP